MSRLSVVFKDKDLHRRNPLYTTYYCMHLRLPFLKLLRNKYVCKATVPASRCVSLIPAQFVNYYEGSIY